MENTINRRKIKHAVYLDPIISRQLKREKGETDRTISEIVEELLSRRYESFRPEAVGAGR